MALYKPPVFVIPEGGMIMSKEKKSRYTEAQARAAKKYLTEVVEEFKIRVPKGQKDIIKNHAAACGESLNQFVIRAIDETMQRDKGNTSQ